MAEIQNKLLSAGASVAKVASMAKKTVGKKKTKEEKVASLTKNSPSAMAAQRAEASLKEHREAKKRSSKPAFKTYEKEKMLGKEPFKLGV